MLNNIILMGRLTAVPELRNTESNIAVTSFCVAVERDYAQAGGIKETDFINVVAWRQTAEFVCKYFTKGQLIAIIGSLQISKYDKDGETKKKAEVIAKQVYFADSKKADAEKPSDEISAETFNDVFQSNPFENVTVSFENEDSNKSGFFPFE